MKRMPGAAASSSNASLRSVSPLPGSSPIDSRPTRGLVDAEAVAGVDRAHLGELHQPLGLHLGVGAGVEQDGRARRRAPGSGWRSAGRLTPLIRPIRSSAEAIVAPVLPAETIADALPSRTASAARTSVESFLRRTPLAGVLVHLDDLGGLDQLEVAAAVARSAGPTRTTGMPSGGRGVSAGEDLAGCAVAAHRVDGDRQHRTVRLLAQPTSTATRSLYQPQAGHTVCGSLAAAQRGHTLRDGAAELPRAGTVAARLRLRLLLLGNGHGSLRLTKRATRG